MDTNDQRSKVLILLILTLTRVKRKRVILSPIAPIIIVYAFCAMATQVILLGRDPQLDRAERYTMIRARRRNIQPP